MPQPEIVLVSACLVGIACRYDGGHKRDARALEYLEHKIAVPVCPELFTGLGIPRPAAEFETGDGFEVLAGKARVMLRDGRVVTAEFLNGCRQALKIAHLVRAGSALLKEQSPCCGVNRIYSAGRLMRGPGIFTAMLLREKIPVRSEAELPEAR